MKLERHLLIIGAGLLSLGSIVYSDEENITNSPQQTTTRSVGIEEYRKRIPDNLFYDNEKNIAYVVLLSTSRPSQSYEANRKADLSRIDRLIDELRESGNESRIKALKKTRERIVSEPARIIHDVRNYRSETQVLENYLVRLENEQPGNKKEINRVKGILVQGYHIGE